MVGPAKYKIQEPTNGLKLYVRAFIESVKSIKFSLQAKS